MLIKSVIRGFDQSLVKLIFTSAGLVCRRQNYRLALRIEGERRPPYAVIGVKPQFLHIRVLRTVQRGDTRAARRQAKCICDLLTLIVRN